MKKGKKKLKIALFHCSFVYSGGGERIAIEGVLGLRKKGHEVDLYAPAIDRENCFPDLLKKANPKPIMNGLPRWFPLRDALDMGFSSLLAPLVAYKFRDYDVFIGENQPGAWFAWVYSRIFGKPYVIYLNQPNRMLYPRSIDLKTGWRTNRNFVLLERMVRIFKPFISYLDKTSTRGANYMAVNGHYIGDIISQIYGKEYVECPAGCDPFPHGPLQFREQKYYQGQIKVNGKSIRKPYILLTNRHYPQKRFDYAILSMPEVIKKYPDALLVITGAFTDVTNDWQKLAKELSVDKNVVWLGEVENKHMGTLYGNAAVYVYTSTEEDFGMGVVEAEEFGVPVVAWKHGGPTVTVEDKKTGFLVKPYSVKDYADKIIWLLGHPKERVEMGKAAHNHVQKNFSWKNHVNVLEKAALDSLKGRSL